MKNPESDSASEWLIQFQREKGRPLRVLHIGNIANNAYNNAKIQRQRGIDADVLSHDYYHIMACPEWEDSEFIGSVGDDMFPDWWRVRMQQPFARPRWFAQGPLDACVRYLLAETANAPSASFLWRALTAERWLLSRRSLFARLVRFLIFVSCGRHVTYVSTPANAIIAKTLGRLSAALARITPGGSTKHWLRTQAAACFRISRVADTSNDLARHRRAMHKRQTALTVKACVALAPFGRAVSESEFDWFFLYWWHPYLRLLFKRYDVIQAYATYTMMPFIQGMRYAAYEHGTIRAIPFQETTEGRFCAATYRVADQVFVTNSDNLTAVDALQIPAEQVACLPHAFDSEKLLHFAASSPLPPRQQKRPVLFFSPARQHWQGDDPGWCKGNDRFLHAAAVTRSKGLNFRIRLVAWGNDLEASKKLAADLGLADIVEWVPTMRKRELWLNYLAADAVIDQFLIRAIGGVTFEAMMLGRRVITAIDPDQTRRFFGETPPVFSCSTAEEIADAMAVVIADPEDVRGHGTANQEWMRNFHSAQRIVEIQVEAYRGILSKDAKFNPAPYDGAAVRPVHSFLAPRV